MARLQTSTAFVLFIIIVAVWRKLSQGRPTLQEKLHGVLGDVAVVVQWYTMFSIGIASFGVYSVSQYFAECAFVGRQEIDDNLQTIFINSNITSMTYVEFKNELTINTFVWLINMIGQLSGLVVIGIAIYHAWALLIIPSQRAAQEGNEMCDRWWHLPKRVNWLLWIIVLPTVFSIETMRANIKVWRIMIGTAPEYATGSFHSAEKLELLYVVEDVEIAAAVQFTAVYAFTRLINSLLANTAIMKGHADEGMHKLAREYKRLLRLGGFIGVWLYIAAGIVRAIINISIAVLLQFVIEATGTIDNNIVNSLEGIHAAFTGLIGLTFTILTTVGVLNMKIMTQTFIVSDKLGDSSKGDHDANRKFLGARILLICSEIVPKIIDIFEKGTPMFERGQEITSCVSFLYMSPEQAEILKITVLNIASLVAVIVNFVVWKDTDISVGLLDSFGNDNQRLLDD